MENSRFAGVLFALVCAVMILAVTSTYSSYVASTNHKNACASRGLVLDTLHDVVAIAVTPPPGKTLTAKQVKAITEFESKVNRRIDLARC